MTPHSVHSLPAQHSRDYMSHRAGRDVNIHMRDREILDINIRGATDTSDIEREIIEREREARGAIGTCTTNTHLSFGYMLCFIF